MKCANYTKLCERKTNHKKRWREEEQKGIHQNTVRFVVFYKVKSIHELQSTCTTNECEHEAKRTKQNCTFIGCCDRAKARPHWNDICAFRPIILMTFYLIESRLLNAAQKWNAKTTSEHRLHCNRRFRSNGFLLHFRIFSFVFFFLFRFNHIFLPLFAVEEFIFETVKNEMNLRSFALNCELLNFRLRPFNLNRKNVHFDRSFRLGGSKWAK